MLSTSTASLLNTQRGSRMPTTKGSTPTRVYAELVRMHQKDGLSFKNVFTFNLDEYYPMLPGALQSYVRFMNEHLFDHLDIPRKNIHIPDGTLPKEDIQEFCRAYEERSTSWVVSTFKSSVSVVPATSVSTNPGRPRNR